MTTLMDLSPLNAWCVWRLEMRGPIGTGAGAGVRRPTKVPYGVGGALARSNDPGTWLDLTGAYELAARMTGAGGLGVFLGSRIAGRWVLAGVDFDCALGAGGMEQWAVDGLRALGAGGYWEISPSGTGVKAFGLIDEGSLAGVREALGLGERQGRKWKVAGVAGGAGGEHPPAIEIYTGVRFFAVTGRGGSGAWDTTALGVWGVGEAQALRLAAERHFGAGPAARPLSDGSAVVVRDRMNSLDGGLGEFDRLALETALGRSERLRALLEDDDMTSVSGDRSAGVVVAMGELSGCGMSREGVWQVVANAGFAGWYREKGDRRQMDRAWSFAVSAREAREARVDAAGWFDVLPDEMIADMTGLTGRANPGASEAESGRKPDVSPRDVVVAPVGHETPSAQLTPFAEETLAREMVEGYGHDLRYVDAFGRWMVWQGWRWRADDTLTGLYFARQICTSASRRAPAALRKGILSGGTIQRVEKLARADRRVATTGASWDSDPWLLNTPVGVVDLRTGAVTEGMRSALMTKSAAVGPDREQGCPLWIKFMERVTDGNRELQAFLQRMAGYCLTGITREHALFFCHGTGGNGKSTFLDILSSILGLEDYAQTADAEIFTAGRKDQHSTEIARLRGARLVITTETEQGRAWSEKRIKEMTGGDAITANFMRQDKFTFKPEFKLLMAGNHKPRIRNVNEAIRRRLHLIPFTVKIPEEQKDKDLADKLKAERGAILQWMIAGCLQWQVMGLQPPEMVRAATDDYLEDEDSKATWFKECCKAVRSGSADEKSLFASWRNWAMEANEMPGTQRAFAEWFSQNRFECGRNSSNMKVWYGINLINSRFGTPVNVENEILEFPKKETTQGLKPVTDESGPKR